MDEFAALAQRVVLTMDDVRGCLVLSRDGLVLGAFPEEQEAELKPAWLRFVHVGEARKGFVEFSDQLWAFVHRGPYAAFVVTGTSVRPGVMLDQLEQAVIAAEETRAKQKEVTLKVPDAAGAPSGRPRTSLHPPADRPAAAPVGAIPAAEEMPSFAAPTGPAEGSERDPGMGRRRSRATAADAGDAGADGGDAGTVAAAGAPTGRGHNGAGRSGPGDPGAPRSRSSRVAAGRGAGVPAAAQWLPPTRVFRAGDGLDAAAGRPRRAASHGSTPPLAAAEPAAEAPRAELGGARPSIEGSPYESVLADEQPAPFGSESSPFARLESEQAAAAAERAEARPEQVASTEARPEPPAAAAEAPVTGGRRRRTRALSGVSRSGWFRRATAHLRPTSRRSPARSTASCLPRSSRGCFSWMGTVTKTSS